MTTTLEGALERMLARVAATEREVGERFPLYADPGTGEWVTTGRGSWAGGFWVGQLWLRARLTGRSEHAQAAKHWAARLSSWSGTDTVTGGMIFWYGAAAGHRLEVSDAVAPLARSAAEGLRATFDPAPRLLPWGTAFGDSAESVIARVDGVAGTVPLLAWAAGTDREQVAEHHLRTHLRLCGTGDEARPAWAYAENRWRQLAEPRPGWARGEAWLLLAVADAAHWLDGEFAETGRGLVRRWVDPSAEIVPAMRGVPGSPPDTSAAAITAVALAKLGQYEQATALAQALVNRHLRAGGHPAAGGLLDGCLDLARPLATHHELVWGNYFLMLALAILTGAVPADLV